MVRAVGWEGQLGGRISRSGRGSRVVSRVVGAVGWEGQ